MNDELLVILKHALGLNQSGSGKSYRNHFVAGESDVKKCRELVLYGLMTEEKGNHFTGQDPIFFVTPQGVLLAKGLSAGLITPKFIEAGMINYEIKVNDELIEKSACDLLVFEKMLGRFVLRAHSVQKSIGSIMLYVEDKNKPIGSLAYNEDIYEITWESEAV